MNTNVHKNGVHFMKMTYNSILFGGGKKSNHYFKIIAIVRNGANFFQTFWNNELKTGKKNTFYK